ncbi:hypothetical protein [Pseudomonas oryzihabitans]|uniref:Uncharacterized protein n=1 Tax=Pseudomonas oryzihabitans TaxID=47885 RepID=A0AAJ2EZ69_9PSED|nr:hypothetical protein [Pseudomonas psychrotolerans]MDR6234045.1 hypothetical protein [Pseudomonas psychrotolerans]
MRKNANEREHKKSFMKWMVESIGETEWNERRKNFKKKIQAAEETIDLSRPIEDQLFKIPENDIDWYIFAAELAWDVPQSDSAYSSRRVYPYIMAIGAQAERLRKVKGVESVLRKMLGNKSSPENQLFELLTAAHYLKNGYEVEFIPENSIVWPDGQKRSPDLLVKKKFQMYVECKRAAKQTKYSQEEEDHWKKLWSILSTHLLNCASWNIADITFHADIRTTTGDDLKLAVNDALKNDGLFFQSKAFSLKLFPINREGIISHYEANSVRADCPVQEHLVFGNINSNEKRNIATIAGSIRRIGEKEDVLNILIDDVESCVGGQWRCNSRESIEKRSKHFKGLIASAVAQLPPWLPGVVHVMYETTEGIDVELDRYNKHIEQLSAFDAGGKKILAFLLHGIGYYPRANDYQWAETVQYFSPIPNIMKLLYVDRLMLGDNSTQSFENTTHWDQDRMGIAGK